MKFNLKTMRKVSIVFLTIVLLRAKAVEAKVRLPQILRDSMVLQRGQEVNIWGWGDKGENVTVQFQNKTYQAQTDEKGKWKIELPPMKAGGPYQMVIEGNNKIVLQHILIGDVWLCSGQSNMVHQMKLHSVRYAGEIAKAGNPEIRQFWIPQTVNLQAPDEDLSKGFWKEANPENVRDFSAVAYFYAKKLYKKYHIPIGIINASVGGTPIQAWMSKEGLKDFPVFLKEIKRNKDSAFIERMRKRKMASYQWHLKKEDIGITGMLPWYNLSYNSSEDVWRRIGLPGYWEDQGVKNLNGVVWYRKEIDVPASMVNKPAKVFLGRIVDADYLYINGHLINHTTYQFPERRYVIPKNILNPGKNLFVIRVINYSGKGGFVPDKPYCLISGKDTVDLKGYWKYKIGDVFTPERVQKKTVNFTVHYQPTALYNGMIAPVTNYTIKGIVWYQGAANTGNPLKYARLQPALIADWRSHWKEGDIPFLYVQLPGYGDYSYLPEESNWAQFRKSQLQSLSVPNTAMVVTIDLGEWNDIHPDRKKPVGNRLALAAEKLAYGDQIVASGPILQSAKVKGNRIILSFNHVGRGLIFKDSSYVTPSSGEWKSAFAIAGADKKFVWAKAQIKNDKIIVHSVKVKDPKYIRYAWADNPVNPDLYNKEGLPASPFMKKIQFKK